MKAQLDNNQKNIICGAVTCLIAAYMFWYARTKIQVNAFIGGFGTDAKTVPSAVFALMFILGLALIAQALIMQRRKFENSKEFKWMSRDAALHILLIAAVTVVYVILLQKIGFFVMSAAYMMFLLIYSKVKPLTAAIITVCVDAALYLIFVVLLKVSITMGVLLI